MTDIAGNYQGITERIRNAASRSGRSGDAVQLIAVSKTVPPESIRQAVACGVTHLGENRLQEALVKREALTSLPLTWHFIGHVQTNKAKKIAENFDWVHSVDRLAVGDALSRYVAGPDRLQVLIEVKLEDEPNKSGAAENDLPGLVASMRDLEGLNLRGLMAVPPPVDDPEQARPYFRRLRELAHDLGLSELSMGMTHDFEIAVEEGATMVRIGTGLFGARK
jgi:pyridoxal phosphate enzyme (YggS family)